MQSWCGKTPAVLLHEKPNSTAPAWRRPLQRQIQGL